MKYIISVITLLLMVLFFETPGLENKEVIIGNYSVLAAVKPTPTPEIILDPTDPTDSTPSAESSSSAVLTPTPTITPTPTPGSVSQNSSNSKPGKPNQESQVPLPHPSVPIVITPFVENSNRVIEKYYNPFSPSGIIQLFNPHNFYTGSIYSPYIMIISTLFSFVLFFLGLILIDKSKISFLHIFRNKLFIKKVKDKKLLQSYYES